MVQLSRALRAGLELFPSLAWTMISVTPRHHAGERLEKIKRLQVAAWRRTRQQRAVKTIFERKVEGTARALEVTHSYAHGWHPHYHLGLLTSEWTDHERRVLLRTWVRSLIREAAGKRPKRPPRAGRVCDWRRAYNAACAAWQARYDDARRYYGRYVRNAIRWSDKRLTRGDGGGALERYLTDIGLELSMGGTKTTKREEHRSSWQVAIAAAAGDVSSRALWSEYEQAMRGARALELDERAAHFADSFDISTISTVLEHGEVVSDCAAETMFDGAPEVGEPTVFVELHPEMMGIVRAYERVNPLATRVWLDAAAGPGELSETAVEARVDACVRAMQSAVASRARHVA